MSQVYADLAVSADGFSTGPNQGENAPFGDVAPAAFHAWMFDHADEHRAELDAIVSASAFIMGRNMFGPLRGEWTGDWRGWWGPEPPYHAPVFVLTNHAREPLVMDGGTTFTFVTDGIRSAMAQARDAAGAGDISIAGGATTINAFLAAGFIDLLRLHVVPLTLGLNRRTDVVRLFDGVPPLRFTSTSVRATPHVTHVTHTLR